MSTITKMIFSVSEKGNPLCQLWVDNQDTTKNSDAIYIALGSQVAYLFFLGVGSQVELKKSKQYYNVTVPDFFTNLFENYKVSPDPTIKAIGTMLNSAFKNAFNSIEYLKNGEVTMISKDECRNMCTEYLAGFFDIYDCVLDNMGKSKNKALKTVAKNLTSETSKASDVKDSNAVVMNYVSALNNFLAKQHIKVSDE